MIDLSLPNGLQITGAEHPAPNYQILIGGKDISPDIRPRLIGLTLTDARGFEADTVELSLDDSDGKLEMPPRGVKMRVYLGWRGKPLVDKGEFTIDELEHNGAPDTLTIRGKSADLRGSMNKLVSRSWHEATVGDIVKQLAEKHSLKPACAAELQSIAIAHIDQSQESDLAFLTRLSKMYGAIATVKAGRLLFIAPGKSVSASGTSLPPLHITRSSGDQHSFSVADRDAYTGVVAYWHDPKTGKTSTTSARRKKKAEEPLPVGVTVNKKDRELLVGDSENVKTLRHIYANKQNAMRAAMSEWSKLQRGVAEFSITLANGMPEAFPEQPVTVSGFKPQIDAADWVAVKVVHNVTDSGYTSQISFEVSVKELPDVNGDDNE